MGISPMVSRLDQGQLLVSGISAHKTLYTRRYGLLGINPMGGALDHGLLVVSRLRLKHT